MVVTCPVCREVVHVSCGYIVRHGTRDHGVLRSICSGSGSPLHGFVDSCCSFTPRA